MSRTRGPVTSFQLSRWLRASRVSAVARSAPRGGSPREGARSALARGAATGGGGPQAPPTRTTSRLTVPQAIQNLDRVIKLPSFIWVVPYVLDATLDCLISLDHAQQLDGAISLQDSGSIFHHPGFSQGPPLRPAQAVDCSGAGRRKFKIGSGSLASS